MMSADWHYNDIDKNAGTFTIVVSVTAEGVAQMSCNVQNREAYTVCRTASSHRKYRFT